jgi:hypothetical protein
VLMQAIMSTPDTPPDDIGGRIAAEMKTICDELPARLNIVAILRDAHARLVAAAPDAPQTFITDKLAEVLREIAAHTVEEFTRRTGQPFLWVDEPEPTEDPNNILMSFSLDEKGNVVF